MPPQLSVAIPFALLLATIRHTTWSPRWVSGDCHAPRALRGEKAKRVPVRRGLELLLLNAAQRATAKAAPIGACGVWTWTALDGDCDNGPTHELLRDDSAGAQFTRAIGRVDDALMHLLSTCAQALCCELTIDVDLLVSRSTSDVVAATGARTSAVKWVALHRRS